MNQMWKTEIVAGVQHLLPEGDLEIHLTSMRCRCKPALVPIQRDSQGWNWSWIVEHEAFDGRVDEEYD